MHHFIKKLADVISSHDLQSIQRELRAIAVSKKNQNKAQGQKRILLLANQFISQNEKPAENWRTSTTCFEQLTDWFEQNTEIENHLQLSMASFCCHLEQMIVNTIDSNEIIILGAAYYAEPHKFIGFLYWLLNNNVSTEAIHQTGLLHHFFAYNSCMINVIQKSYTMLENLSDNTTTFLNQIKENSCGMRGFINCPTESGDTTAFSSYNLQGIPFTHTDRLSEISQRRRHLLGSFTVQTIENAVALFHLFEWELIKQLNFRNETHCHLFEEILSNEPTKEKIISEFPNQALRGTFSVEFSNDFLEQIHATVDMFELQDIVNHEPFYIHSLTYQNIFHVPERRDPRLMSNIGTIINTLCTNEKYKSISHIFYLGRLAFNLIERPFPPHSLQARNTDHYIQSILETILEIIIPFGNNIDDNVINSIDPHVLQRLKPIVSKKLVQISQSVETAIHKLNNGTINYDALQYIWGSQLSTCNLLFSLYPDSPPDASYPRTIYVLRSRVLQSCIPTNTAFSLDNLLSAMTPDTATQKRILQETLIDPDSQLPLIEAILDYRTASFTLYSLITDSFNNIKNILFHAFTTDSSILQIALTARAPDNNHFVDIISATLSENRVNAFRNAWRHISFDETNKIALLRILLNHLQDDTINLETTIINFYLRKMDFLISRTEETELPDGMLLSLFSLAIKYENVGLTQTLCSLKGINQLTPENIQSELFHTAILWEKWNMIGLLCGLSNADNLNTNLVQTGNVRLYFKVIERYKRDYDVTKTPKDALQYKNDQNQSLLHLAADYCTFKNFKMIFREFTKIFTRDEILPFLEAETIEGQKVECTIASNRNQEEINSFLNTMRSQYARHRDNGFFSNPFNRYRNRDDREEENDQQPNP